MASAASGSGYQPQTLGASWYQGGAGALTDLVNKYAGNETLANLTVGTLADSFATRMKAGIDLDYQSAMMSNLKDYTYGLESLKAGNALNLLQAEGGIARDLANIQGGFQIQGKQLDLEGTKYSADKVAQANMYMADRTAKASMYGADRNLEGTRFTAQSDLEGRKYVADAGLAGTKYTADSEERRIGLLGQQERLNLQEKTNQEKELRRDARGAIRSQGSRFFG
jgi:hypothetical protein